MIKKILGLTKIFILEYYQNLDIFDKESKKLNKKSMFTWLLIITIFALTFISYKVITFFDSVGYGILFLKIYFPIITVIFTFQSILICSNVFYFSKDLEKILPLPLKPIELLIAKFLNIVCIIYFSEILFLGIPLLLYGILVNIQLLYFPIMILVLLIFPILIVTVIGIIMMFFMKLSKFIKNKDIFQIILVLIITFIMTALVTELITTVLSESLELEGMNIRQEIIKLEELNIKLDKINKYFIFINPCIKMLSQPTFINLIINLPQILIIDLVAFLIFIYFGKKLYLKNILKNIEYINTKKININNKKYIKNKYKKNSIKKAYLKNEFKKIVKNPVFFIQGIFQNIFIIIIILMILNSQMPNIIEMLSSEEMQSIEKNEFILQIIIILINCIQILFTFGNLSLTGISRDGKEAIFLKYIPVPLYKQFKYKTIPQIFINTIIILGILLTIGINKPDIPIIYGIAVFIIAMILNMINSNLMLIVDLKKPNLNWDNSESVMKNNSNKIYQYATTIGIILILVYCEKVLIGIDIRIALMIIIGLFSILLLLIKKYIKININKLFNNIK